MFEGGEVGKREGLRIKCNVQLRLPVFKLKKKSVSADTQSCQMLTSTEGRGRGRREIT